PSPSSTCSRLLQREPIQPHELVGDVSTRRSGRLVESLRPRWHNTLCLPDASYLPGPEPPSDDKPTATTDPGCLPAARGVTPCARRRGRGGYVRATRPPDLQGLLPRLSRRRRETPG